MANKLVIVESPTKAKTISRYLGRGYSIKASMGHVRDLPKSKLGVDTEHDFQPQYLIPRDKSKTVKELKESVASAREVYLATDPDREGEAIAWHLIQATGMDTSKARRVVFHEITPDAVRNAMANPREIDMRLVDAQQARRVLDRLVGYNISPLLWKKVKRGLSAGRVQSVALRLVVDREREIQSFVPVEYWTISADLAKQPAKGRKPSRKDQFRALLVRINDEKVEISNEEQARAIIEALEGATYKVLEVKQREIQRKPAPPFITSTMQQEASRKLNFNARRTMSVAQSLYEGVSLGDEGDVGLITYMRTDSTNVATVAQEEARQVIAQLFGDKYLPEKPPVYTKKAKNAQEAHEAIRPTSVKRHPDAIKQYLTSDQYKLYKLIWQRFIASQMANAIIDGTTVDIAAEPRSGGAPYIFRATGSVIKFDGFLVVYQEGKDDDQEEELGSKALPPMTEGEVLNLIQLLPEQHFTQPPPRYTEASLVKALEEQGIGRPSTYAIILSTLQERYYVVKDGKALVPTELGMLVNDLLVEHFPDIVDVNFTSQMEEELDDIASGERAWVPVIKEFYGPFERKVRIAEEEMQKVDIQDEPAGENCPNCGRPMVFKMGRYGKFIACSGFPECRTTKAIVNRTGVQCPACRQGELVERRSRKGRRSIFYACDRYPDCEFTISAKPLPQPCPACGGLQVEDGKNGQKCIRCDGQGNILQKSA
ncbi:DNA topoisomerase I [Thermobaculum terrenum ATCC BAA-798]|uniref:DNA topoisomerase 1 n=1 Tax=Thermobaculum terrenum (strain ATCC BAA-798 / CCMEE 7001 / YNP1) TaxID=525904 RepID=D1CEQ0_THET1|nr:type I DNA topoisomerase [Thermobaculum terrenum]ACZ41406.1 DNA topoisomerase I [Thermobaculum terrenum ATCC BAA-798]